MHRAALHLSARSDDDRNDHHHVDEVEDVADYGGQVGSKLFLVVAITAFISCVLSLQPAGSRLLYGSARDRMLPFSPWLSHMSAKHAVPTNSLLVACLVPIALCLFIFWRPDSLARVTAFAILGIYIAFQAVVLAALRQRLRGWRPAGWWNLGSDGMVVNVAALAYGIFAMFLLARPGEAGTFLDRWIVVIRAILVLGTGLAYMLIAKPYDHSEGVPEGDAIEVADRLRSLREQSPAG
jgi:amino acid transporter